MPRIQGRTRRQKPAADFDPAVLDTGSTEAAVFLVREGAADTRKAQTLPMSLAWSETERGVWLYHADCLSLLDRIAAKYPDGVFDMIFADPPYFLSNGGITCHAGRMVSVNKGDWDKSRGPEENHNFNREWLKRCHAVLKPNGTIWVSGTAHVIHSVGFAMQQLGYKLLNDITWIKPNPPPNLSCRYFTHSTETIIWAARSPKSRHYFNYDLMKRLGGNKQMKSVWPASTDAPADAWEVPPPPRSEKKNGKHPTQKPVALLERIVLASTRRGDFVLDPFMGSGTTGVAAVQLGRQFVGVELDEDYAAIAARRMREETHPRQTELGLRPTRKGTVQ